MDGTIPMNVMNDRKRVSSSEGESDSYVEGLQRTSKLRKLYLEGEVRLGSRSDCCVLKLFPLVSHSARVRKLVESICNREMNIVVDLPDCPGGPDVFRIVEDFCYNLMEERDIAISNVVKLIAACNFLQMDSLADRAAKFLEESVFVSFESCLSVLATYDCNDLCNVDEDPLFQKCKNAFLRKIVLPFKHPTKASSTMGCDVQSLWRVAEVLSPNVAELIYRSCRSQQFGLFFLGDEDDDRPWIPMPLCTHFRGDPAIMTGTIDVTFYSAAEDCNRGVFWLERLLVNRASWSRKASFMIHLAKSIQMENDVHVKVPTRTICLSRLRWSFVCALLFVASCQSEKRDKMRAQETAMITKDLNAEIVNLQMIVSRGLGDGTFWSSKEEWLDLGHSSYNCSFSENTSYFVQYRVERFDSDTFQGVLRNFKSLGSDLSTILPLGEVVEQYVSSHYAEDGDFSTGTALLVFKEFPNDARPSHQGIYEAFEYYLEKNDMPPDQVLELSTILDYHKLPVEMASKFFDEVGKTILLEGQNRDCNTRLLERLLSQQRVNLFGKKKANDKVCKLREKLHLQKVDLIEMRNKFRMQKDDLINITGDKLLAETKLELVRRDLEEEKEKIRRDLEEEKEKTTCQICFMNRRDVLCLPCMHFLYCSACLQLHHQKRKTCPACRSCTSGVLKCNLSV